MNAEIISVGTELLLGEVSDTNAKFLSEELSALGINVYYRTTAGDNPTRLFSVLEAALLRSDLVITSGGLGPTPDDITKETIARVMGEELVLDEESLLDIENYFKRMNRKMSESNKKQAMLPKNAIILKNNNGTAPGAIIEKNSKTVIMLPGPPGELEKMYRESVLPYLVKKSEGALHSANIKLFGIGESVVGEILKDMMEKSKNPTVAPYAETSGVRLRVTAFAKEEKQANALLSEAKDKIREKLSEFIYSEEGKTLPETVVGLMREKKLTLAAAESCSGGMFSKMTVDIPGSSDIMNESIVTYSNQAKMKYLKVRGETLEKYGAVSEKTAKEMAEGIKNAANSDIGVGITGIAGPGGGSIDKPVGLVYVAVSAFGDTAVKELRLCGTREKIRYTACLHAFDMIFKKILDF